MKLAERRQEQAADMSTDSTDEAREAFHRLLGEMRPKLHRYCARMTGSVIDGEDAVQEAFVKAIEAFPGPELIANSEGWLFRIAHNAALDFLRRRTRREAGRVDADWEMIADPSNINRDRQVADASLRTFMHLPVAQRSSVLLMDVLGCSLREISGILGASIPAVKATLHRGRTRLREIANEPDDRPAAVLTERERSLLAAYVDRFNARDFDAVRGMLADEVRLELVSRTRMNGRKEVGTYLHNYARTRDWRLCMGLLEGRPAVLVRDPAYPYAPPSYVVLLEWQRGQVTDIRDFRYAQYVIEGAELAFLD